MNGTRLSVCVPGASASLVLSAARLAESHNVDLWIGDLAGGAPNSDDSYVLTAAAGAAAVTVYIRIGVFLTLSGSATPLRLAEDVGVVDQASRGRLELGLVVSGDETRWQASARQLLGAWHDWPAGDRSVAVTPRPAQAWMPRVLTPGTGKADVARIAASLSGGVMSFGEPGGFDADTGERGRTVLAISPDLGPDGVEDWLARDVLGAVRSIRAAVDRVKADEVIMVLPVEPTRLTRDIRALGVVVGPSLRCSAHHVELLAPDSWNWLTRLGHLHHPPQ